MVLSHCITKAERLMLRHPIAIEAKMECLHVWPLKLDSTGYIMKVERMFIAPLNQVNSHFIINIYKKIFFPLLSYTKNNEYFLCSSCIDYTIEQTNRIEATYYQKKSEGEKNAHSNRELNKRVRERESKREHYKKELVFIANEEVQFTPVSCFHFLLSIFTHK